MPRFYRNKWLPMLFLPFILVGIAAAAVPDPRLLSLVPSGAQLVAGISASSIQGQPDNFVLITHNNTVDLEDFFALTGADGARIIHQIVFVAMANKVGEPAEHSLLVSGHFDQPHVFKSAVDGGAEVMNYRKIPVLEIQPFGREHGIVQGVRWLAILDSRVLVFGSVSSTQLEIDRYLAHSQADESLLRRLARIRSKDQTWCLLSASVPTLSSPAHDKEIHGVLAALNPELAELAQSGNELQFGLYYGRRVEFEYEVTLALTADGRVGRDSFKQRLVEPARSAALLPTPHVAEDANSFRGMIKIPIPRYNTWLAEIRRQRIPVD